MPITSEQINLLLIQQEEILLTLSSMSTEFLELKKDASALKEFVADTRTQNINLKVRGL